MRFVSVVSALVIVGCSAAPSVSETPPVASSSPGPIANAAIAGRVEGPLHQAIAGALVAAVPLDAPRNEPPFPRAVVVSDAGGGFAFRDLADGRYAVTAATASLTAGYAGAVEVRRGAAVNLAVTLGGDGITVTGRVSDRHGNAIDGARLAAARFSGMEGDVFPIRVESDGAFTAKLPKAEYELLADGPGRVASSVHAASPDRALLIQVDDPTPLPPTDADVSDWIRSRGVPIATLDPTRPTTDLGPLKSIIGRARVVAIGESSHGTDEFIRLKQRIFELMVDEMGFDALAIEANLPESMAVDDYIVKGVGSLRQVIAQLGFWALETEEFSDLVEWMRHYNANRAHSKKLHFYGVDAQFAPRAIALALDYLKRVDPGAAEAFAKATKPIEPSMASETFGKLGPAERAAIEKAIADLLTRFDAEHVRWAKKTGEDAFVWARKEVDVVRQTEAYFANPDARDTSMSENVRWLLDHGPRDRKIALFAHDAHIAFDVRVPAMGVSLRAALGADYFALGFAWAKGTVRAFHPNEGGGKVGTFEVGAPPKGSLDERLGSAGMPLFAIDLRQAPAPIQRWLDARILRREMGGLFFDAATTLRNRSPSQSFDALIFVADAHATRELGPSHPK